MDIQALKKRAEQRKGFYRKAEIAIPEESAQLVQNMLTELTTIGTEMQRLYQRMTVLNQNLGQLKTSIDQAPQFELTE